MLDLGSLADHATVDIMTGERRKGKQRITSFGEQQAKYAKQAIEEGLDLGENLFECTQGKLLPLGKQHPITFWHSANHLDVVLPEPGEVCIGYCGTNSWLISCVDGSKPAFPLQSQLGAPSHAR